MSKATERSLAEWDAEIEADFQRAVAATKADGRKQRGRRLIGCPMAYLIDVCRLTKGRAALLVALLVFRRTVVCGSRTVTLPGGELAELGIDRSMKRKALARLKAGGLIRIEQDAPRHTTRATLLWQAG
jgi:hypothetical protein